MWYARPTHGALRMQKAHNIVVIGAGASGLQCARALLKRGCFQVLILEQGEAVGGVWNKKNICSGVQVPHLFYEFAEYPWPAHLQQDASAFPSSQAVQAYIQAYAEHFGLVQHIRFRCQLLRLQPAPQGGWTIIYLDQAKGVFQVLAADYVIMATGMYCVPNIPVYKGMQHFRGLQLHANDFTSPALLAGKRVVVVGSGRSALDCASMVAASQQAVNVTWLFRHSHWPIPQRMATGLPMQRFLFSRLPSLLLPPYYTASSSEQGVHRLSAPLKRSVWKWLQSSIVQQFGLNGGLLPSVPLQQDMLFYGQVVNAEWNRIVLEKPLKPCYRSSSTARTAKQDNPLGDSAGRSYSTPPAAARCSNVAAQQQTSQPAGQSHSIWKDMFHCSKHTATAHDISHQFGARQRQQQKQSSSVQPQARSDASSSSNASGSASVVPLCGDIERFDKDRLLLRSGGAVPADVVLYCTGYKKTYDYLDFSVRSKLGLQKDGLPLYRHMLPPLVPGLAFVGCEASSYNTLLTAGLQAEWLAAVLAGQTVLPDVESMQDDVRRMIAWLRGVFPAHSNRASAIQLFMGHYHAQLLEDLQMGPPHHPWVLQPLTARDYSFVFTAPLEAHSRGAANSPGSHDECTGGMESVAAAAEQAQREQHGFIAEQAASPAAAAAALARMSQQQQQAVNLERRASSMVSADEQQVFTSSLNQGRSASCMVADLQGGSVDAAAAAAGQSHAVQQPEVAWPSVSSSSHCVSLSPFSHIAAHAAAQDPADVSMPSAIVASSRHSSRTARRSSSSSCGNYSSTNQAGQSDIQQAQQQCSLPQQHVNTAAEHSMCAGVRSAAAGTGIVSAPSTPKAQHATVLPFSLEQSSHASCTTPDASAAAEHAATVWRKGVNRTQSGLQRTSTSSCSNSAPPVDWQSGGMMRSNSSKLVCCSNAASGSPAVQRKYSLSYSCAADDGGSDGVAASALTQHTIEQQQLQQERDAELMVLPGASLQTQAIQRWLDSLPGVTVDDGACSWGDESQHQQLDCSMPQRRSSCDDDNAEQEQQLQQESTLLPPAGSYQQVQQSQLKPQGSLVKQVLLQQTVAAAATSRTHSCPSHLPSRSKADTVQEQATGLAPEAQQQHYFGKRALSCPVALKAPAVVSTPSTSEAVYRISAVVAPPSCSSSSRASSGGVFSGAACGNSSVSASPFVGFGGESAHALASAPSGSGELSEVNVPVKTLSSAHWVHEATLSRRLSSCHTSMDEHAAVTRTWSDFVKSSRRSSSCTNRTSMSTPVSSELQAAQSCPDQCQHATSCVAAGALCRSRSSGNVSGSLTAVKHLSKLCKASTAITAELAISLEREKMAAEDLLGKNAASRPVSAAVDGQLQLQEAVADAQISDVLPGSGPLEAATWTSAQQVGSAASLPMATSVVLGGIRLKSLVRHKSLPLISCKPPRTPSAANPSNSSSPLMLAGVNKSSNGKAASALGSCSSNGPAAAAASPTSSRAGQLSSAPLMQPPQQQMQSRGGGQYEFYMQQREQQPCPAAQAHSVHNEHPLADLKAMLNEMRDASDALEEQQRQAMLIATLANRQQAAIAWAAPGAAAAAAAAVGLSAAHMSGHSSSSSGAVTAGHHKPRGFCRNAGKLRAADQSVMLQQQQQQQQQSCVQGSAKAQQAYAKSQNQYVGRLHMQTPQLSSSAAPQPHLVSAESLPAAAASAEACRSDDCAAVATATAMLMQYDKAFETPDDAAAKRGAVVHPSALHRDCSIAVRDVQPKQASEHPLDRPRSSSPVRPQLFASVGKQTLAGLSVGSEAFSEQRAQRSSRQSRIAAANARTSKWLQQQHYVEPYALEQQQQMAAALRQQQRHAAVVDTHSSMSAAASSAGQTQHNVAAAATAAPVLSCAPPPSASAAAGLGRDVAGTASCSSASRPSRRRGSGGVVLDRLGSKSAALKQLHVLKKHPEAAGQLLESLKAWHDGPEAAAVAKIVAARACLDDNA